MSRDAFYFLKVRRNAMKQAASNSPVVSMPRRDFYYLLRQLDEYGQPVIRMQFSRTEGVTIYFQGKPLEFEK